MDIIKDMNLRNSVVFISGSSSGIGKETALKFAKKGSKVVITYNHGRDRGNKIVNIV